MAVFDNERLFCLWIEFHFFYVLSLRRGCTLIIALNPISRESIVLILIRKLIWLRQRFFTAASTDMRMMRINFVQLHFLLRLEVIINGFVATEFTWVEFRPWVGWGYFWLHFLNNWLVLVDTILRVDLWNAFTSLLLLCRSKRRWLFFKHLDYFRLWSIRWNCGLLRRQHRTDRRNYYFTPIWRWGYGWLGSDKLLSIYH